jgi:hypothetical protein
MGGLPTIIDGRPWSWNFGLGIRRRECVAGRCSPPFSPSLLVVDPKVDTGPRAAALSASPPLRSGMMMPPTAKGRPFAFTERCPDNIDGDTAESASLQRDERYAGSLPSGLTNRRRRAGDIAPDQSTIAVQRRRSSEARR